MEVFDRMWRRTRDRGRAIAVSIVPAKTEIDRIARRVRARNSYDHRPSVSGLGRPREKHFGGLEVRIERFGLGPHRIDRLVDWKAQAEADIIWRYVDFVVTVDARRLPKDLEHVSGLPGSLIILRRVVEHVFVGEFRENP